MGILSGVVSPLKSGASRARSIAPGGVKKTDEAQTALGDFVHNTDELGESAAMTARVRRRLMGASTPAIIVGGVVLVWLLYEMRII